jgi:DNA-binding transcriptional LysR family regulator
MRYKRLDLNLLTALRALLTEKNVTRAGEALFVSQSAMSGILARLREYFDDQLIVPVGRRMELTPLGESLVEKVNDLLLQIDATLGTKPEFDPLTSRRHFSIVASDYLISVLMLDVLRDIHHQAPGLSIEFRQPSSTAHIGLEDGEVDFVINPQDFSVSTQSSCELFEDTYSLVVDNGNQEIGDHISLGDYKKARHVIFQNEGRPMFETWFAKSHGERQYEEVLTASFSLLPMLVIGTSRVATLHTRQAQLACSVLPLRMVRLDFETPRLVETLQWHKYRDHDLGNQWLRERIIERAKAMPAIP